MTPALSCSQSGVAMAEWRWKPKKLIPIQGDKMPSEMLFLPSLVPFPGLGLSPFIGDLPQCHPLPGPFPSLSQYLPCPGRYDGLFAYNPFPPA